MIFRIARLELSTLFYSPVAWLVLIVFSFQNGFHYAYLVDMLNSMQEAGMNIPPLTQAFFTNPLTEGLFINVQQKLFLFMPLLTMGLMSREIGSGSIKLLFSSPVSTTQIVMGKFLSMMVYAGMLLLLLCPYIIAAYYAVPNLDLPFLLGGLLGLYLLACSYAAIGLFMSCLTSYQVVAAISTLVVLSILNYIGRLGQGMDLVRDLTYLLSIAGRADQMIAGLVISKDVVYFLVYISLFLGFSILKLKAGRQSKSFLVHTARYTGLLLAALIIGYISTRPGLLAYADLTVNKERTLTPASQELISQLKGPVTITTYANALDNYFYYMKPDQRNVDLARTDDWRRFMPGLKEEYVYYYDTSTNDYLFSSNPNLSVEGIARKIAKTEKIDPGIFLTPQQIRERINLLPEENRIVRVVTMGDRQAVLRLFEDNFIFPSEPEIAAAMKQLLEPSPVVGFLAGHGERNIREIRERDHKIMTAALTVRGALVNQGFSLREITEGQPLDPATLSVLVISDPLEPLSEQLLSDIRNYVNKGGNLMVLSEPGRQALLAPLLATWGISLQPGVLVQHNRDVQPDLVLNDFSPGCPVFAPDFERMKANPVPIIMTGAASLSWTPDSSFRYVPVMQTAPGKAWRTTDLIEPDKANKQYSALPGDTGQAQVTALALLRTHNGREQKILVAADADWLSNTEYRRFLPPASRNVRLGIQLFSWFADNRFPIDIYRPEARDKTLRVTEKGIAIQQTIFWIIIPATLLLSAVILLIRRVRK